MTRTAQTIFFILPLLFLQFLAVPGARAGDISGTLQHNDFMEAESLAREARLLRQQGLLLESYQYYIRADLLLQKLNFQDTVHLHYSYQLCRELLSMTDTLLGQLRNSASRMVLVRYLHQRYERAIELGYDLYGVKGDLVYLDESFLLVEKSRTLMLAEAVRTAEMQIREGPFRDFLMHWKNLNAKIFVLKSRIDRLMASDQNDALKLRELNDSLSRLQNSADSLQFHFSGILPDQMRLIYQNPGDHPAGIQKILGSDQALMEYFAGDSAIFLFVITNQSRYWTRIPYDSSCRASFARFRKSIETADPGLFALASYDVYKRIFRPAEPLLRRTHFIRLIPDGELNELPFDALISDTLQQGSYSEMRFLIKRFCFSLSPSTALLDHRSKDRKFTESNKEMIAFAPGFSISMKDSIRKNCPSFTDSVYLSLPEQRFSQRVLEEISGDFKGEVYTNQNATLKRFIAEAPNYSIIHLASHSIADADDPLKSRIVFAWESCDSSSEPYLYASSIYQMDLDAELTVLGSCATGKGNFSRGEGMISLAYAFNYAGCPSLVYSLWDVDEKETSALMQSFYSGIAGGLSKNVALRNAKLEILSKDKGQTSDPYYWAGFVLSGETTPLKDPAETTPGNILITWIGAVALIGLYFLFKLRKKQS